MNIVSAFEMPFVLFYFFFSFYKNITGKWPIERNKIVIEVKKNNSF